MFTGLVTAVGTVESAMPSDGGVDLRIASPWTDLALGESVAVDGACFTVTALGPGSFAVHVIATSLQRTTVGAWSAGRRVNLERALQVGDRLGGHIVQGHVDGVGVVVAVRQEADTRLIDIEVPQDVAAASVPLGSITVDGVSLTVNAIPADGVIRVALIPFTLEHTTLGERRAGDKVQVEGDAVGKYVRRMMDAQRPRGTS